ncbi:hypothetical protein [Haloarcula nitratireducens]|uniref:Uncharacterized protein n=1 Tax=Haloarcula nitratireducens TaxID=2487749 RepID=A0AAW4PCN3_9EURY|nr:hypothetical protein [Halomicroarcula nitratireducens]MBX0295473.1 hypothetical protein [Halomicroarcula nitratireducens]
MVDDTPADETLADAALSVYDHLRPTTGGYPAGIYRVVGASEGDLALLRVADADDRRVNTGELYHVPAADRSAFEPAENPDGNRPATATMRSSLDRLYWSARVFVRSLAAHPIASAIALALFLAGEFGQGALSLSPLVASALIIVGGLSLVYIGSGRL